MLLVVVSALSTIASAATVIGLVLQLLRRKERPKTYMLLAVAVLMSALSGVLWGAYSSLREENRQLRSARQQAAELVATWPTPDALVLASRGECQGVLLSGLAFIEAYRELFPETYEATKTLVLSHLSSGHNGDVPRPADTFRMQEAARAVIRMVGAIRLPGPASGRGG